MVLFTKFHGVFHVTSILAFIVNTVVICQVHAGCLWCEVREMQSEV